jgi:hypothetical protein
LGNADHPMSADHGDGQGRFPSVDGEHIKGNHDDNTLRNLVRGCPGLGLKQLH